jgi:hypothetical protein
MKKQYGLWRHKPLERMNIPLGFTTGIYHYKCILNGCKNYYGKLMIEK